jgi:hypothetical protein
MELGMAWFNGESTSSVIVITSNITLLKSTRVCIALKILTCRIRDSPVYRPLNAEAPSRYGVPP